MLGIAQWDLIFSSSFFLAIQLISQEVLSGGPPRGENEREERKGHGGASGSIYFNPNITRDEPREWWVAQVGGGFGRNRGLDVSKISQEDGIEKLAKNCFKKNRIKSKIVLRILSPSTSRSLIGKNLIPNPSLFIPRGVELERKRDKRQPNVRVGKHLSHYPHPSILFPPPSVVLEAGPRAGARARDWGWAGARTRAVAGGLKGAEGLWAGDRGI